MRATRTTLGKHFSEGARLAWLALAERGWCANDLREQMKGRDDAPLGVGVVDGFLYGDGSLTLRSAVQVEDLLGVPVRAWLKPPTRAFSLENLRRRHGPRVSANLPSRKVNTRTGASVDRCKRSAGAR